MQAVSAAIPQREHSFAQAMGRLGWLSAAAALAAIAAVVFSRREMTQPATPAEIAPADVAAWMDSAQSFSHWATETWMPNAAEAVQSNGLQRELDAVYADARSAVAFLELNFLPAATVGDNALPGRDKG
jgi:hypothetical protein